MKTGRRDENIAFDEIWRNSEFVAKFELLTNEKWHLWRQNLAEVYRKQWRRFLLNSAGRHGERRVRAYNGVLGAEKPWTVLTAVGGLTVIHCWKGLIFGWRKTGEIPNWWPKFWRNLHFLTKEKWHFWRQNPLEPEHWISTVCCMLPLVLSSRGTQTIMLPLVPSSRGTQTIMLPLVPCSRGTQTMGSQWCNYGRHSSFREIFYDQPRLLYCRRFKLQTDTPVTPAMRNGHTNFRFSTLFSELGTTWEKQTNRQTGRQTDRQGS